jgi:hypothetical protein
MKRRRRAPEQIIRKLAESDKLLAHGQPLEDVPGTSTSPSRPGTAGGGRPVS